MPDTPETQSMPSPARLTEYAFAFQRTAALRAAVALDLFTAIGAGEDTVPQVALRCGAEERGVQALCDFLVALDLLTKDGERYAAAPDADFFLNRGSAAFIGDTLDFVVSETQLKATLSDPAAPVRRGGTALAEAGQLVAPDHPDWTTYAQAMAPLMARSAGFLADLVASADGEVRRVLDVAAGPGQSGIALAKRFSEAQVTALDWPGVLEVARRNAEAAGVADRWQALPGSALEVSLGGLYDVALVVRFLHLLSPSEGEAFLTRLHAALALQGRIVALQATLNEDRVSPPFTAMMNFNILATTPGGQVYTATELEDLLYRTGFTRLEWYELPESDERAVIGWKQ
ncbi:MAG: methyltransferase [Roseovarius sp.]|uniref:methyltransferase n=1 Tax=Roseovarius sp. TaxID=1486281 RepID=UPI004057E758